MGERDFQTEVIDRLGRIEERQNMTYEQVQKQQDDIKESHDTAVHADQSAKSAHHRIDNIRSDVVALGTLVAFVVNLILHFAK